MPLHRKGLNRALTENELDFQDCMIDAIEANCNLFAPIDVPIIKINVDGTGSGIAFMLTPIGEETRFMDGSRDRMYAFQISARSPDQLQVLNTLFSINRFIDGLKSGDIKSKNGTFEFINAVIRSVPNLVQADTHGFLYVSNFEAELLLK